jgi:hypothetical protein
MGSAAIRDARVGDLLPSALAGRTRPRRIDATAIVQPGAEPIDAYLAALRTSHDVFADWDGVISVLEPDEGAVHRLVIADRYRQVYAVHDAADATDLPDAEAVTEWFRFLATACPECGVLDDPLLAGPTP